MERGRQNLRVLLRRISLRLVLLPVPLTRVAVLGRAAGILTVVGHELEEV
jgi:hypothetical protein